MLHVYFGDMPNAIYNTAVYFKNVYDDDWIVDEFNKKMILDVDKSTVLGNGVIDSPVLGKISPERLSGGVKTLMLIRHMPEQVFNASACGDNCAKWVLKIAEKKDLTVYLQHIMHFEGSFKIRIMNTGKIVCNPKEYVAELLEAEEIEDERKLLVQG